MKPRAPAMRLLSVACFTRSCTAARAKLNISAARTAARSAMMLKGTGVSAGDYDESAGRHHAVYLISGFIRQPHPCLGN